MVREVIFCTEARSATAAKSLHQTVAGLCLVFLFSMPDIKTSGWNGKHCVNKGWFGFTVLLTIGKSKENPRKIPLYPSDDLLLVSRVEKVLAESYRSATVWCRMSAAVADSVTVQAISSLAMAPKPRLFFLTTLQIDRQS